MKINMIKINSEQRRRPAGGVSLADHPKVRGFNEPYSGGREPVLVSSSRPEIAT